MPDRKTLLKRFTVLEDQRRSILERLHAMDPQTLRTSPAPGSWSVAQVVLHLAIAEEGMMAYLNKKRSVGGHGPAGAGAPFRLGLLNLALVLPVKYKAPAVVATVPECSFDEATQRWDAVRRTMRSTFDTLPEELIGHGLFKHPSAGKFDLVQGIRFMGMHVERHRGQIDRILRARSR